MDYETKTSLAQAEVALPEPPLRRAPTFYLIIFFKIGKGLLAAFFATVLFFQPATKLPTVYESFMGRTWVKQTFYYLRIHPENKFFTRLATKIENITDAGVREAAIGALLWALFPLTEGIGMMFRVSWAGWLAISESAFFVPVELYKLLEDFTWFMVGVTIINIGIVLYLYLYRDQLFHHHHHRHAHGDG